MSTETPILDIVGVRNSMNNVRPLRKPTPEIVLGLQDEVARAERTWTTPSVDLTGKPKLVFVVGPGRCGKTTMARWILERPRTEPIHIATVDPTSRELGQYYPDKEVLQPGSSEPRAVKAWLEEFIGTAAEFGQSALVDCGGGDTALPQLVAETGGADMVGMLQTMEVQPVVLYMVSSRVSDLTTMARMRKAGFCPPASAVVLNLGMAPEPSFQALTEHPAYKAALDEGVATVWMPMLHSAERVEKRLMAFRDAAVDGCGLPVFDPGRTRKWLRDMDAEMTPIVSWLP